MNIKKRYCYIIILLLVITISGCGERKVVITEQVVDSKSKQSILKSEITAEADKFDPRGWQTVTDKLGDGSPEAIPGGRITVPFPSYPPTIRTVGRDTNLASLSLLGSLVYESLLSLDYETLENKPQLASHWRISEDKKSFWFRIDPRARFTDGYPVTAHDVVATFKLLTDPGIESPSTQQLYSENFYLPVAESNSIVRVDLKKVHWRSLNYFSSFSIFPAHHLAKVTGATFLTKYQQQMLPGTGPYDLDLLKTKKGKRLVLRKKHDYWAEDLLTNEGLYNFHEIEFRIVRDERLTMEKFKKGELDIFIPSRARWWVEDLTADKFPLLKRGLVLKRKVFNYKPLGTSGLAFNTLASPFDDLRVRKAFSMLWNIEELNQKMFFGEYVRCSSYFQGTIYQNEENDIYSYQPQKAIKLLEEAGWKLKKGEPIREKDGKKFTIKLMIPPSYNRVFTPLQQSLKKAAINLELVNMTSQASFEKIMNRNFQLAFLAWTGMIFPNPETSMHSKYAEVNGTNNITGLANEKIDELCEKYNNSFSAKERIFLLKELDKIAVANANYAFGWVAPYAARIALHNRFGYPDHCLGFAGDWRALFAYWWQDPEKTKEYEKALSDKSIELSKGSEIIDLFGKA